MTSEVTNSLNVKDCYEFNVTETNFLIISLQIVNFFTNFLPITTIKFQNKIYH